ncbi:MAG: hypothetical protein ACOX6W_01975 [Lentisphaeria bacterium]|jgi:hypothetical protein
MKSIIPPFSVSFLILAAILCSGCVSKYLVDSCTCHYPTVESYHSVYWKGDCIAVSYSVQAPQYPKQEKCADSYWAMLRRSKLKDSSYSNSGISIHRTPLPKRIKNKWEELPIIEFSSRDFIRSQPLSEVPDIYRNKHWLYIRYSPTNKALIKDFSPSGAYIKPSKYPQLATLFPFAVIGDILTLPALMMAPAIHWQD